MIRNNRDFTVMWLGQAVSQLGSRGYGVAIMLWVLAATDSPAIVGLVSTVTLAALTLAAIPAGVIVDRFDRRRVMVGADISSATAATSIAVLAYSDTFALAPVLIAAATLGIGWAVRGLAESAALPNVVDDEDIPRAVTMFEVRGYATGLAGPPIAAATYGIAAAIPFATQAIAFLTAGLAAWSVRRPLQKRQIVARQISIREGLRWFWQQRSIRNLAGLTAVGDFVLNGCGLVVVVLLAESMSPAIVGIMLALAYGAGMVGAVVVPGLLDRIGRNSLLVLSAVVSAFAVMGMIGQPPLVIALAYAVLLFVRPAWQIIADIRMAEAVDDQVRGRVGSAVDLVTGAPVLFAPVLVGLALTAVGPAWVFLVLGLAIGIVAAVSVSSRAVRDVVQHPLPADEPQLF